MPYLPAAQAFLEQSRLLISARPTTTRITTKYTLPHPSQRSKTRKPPTVTTDTTSTSPPPQSSPEPQSQHPAQTQPPKATLTLKTYDPVSGVCLKYRTNKAAEVGRLVVALGRCGTVMAALPESEEGEAKDEAGGGETEVDGAESGVRVGKEDGRGGVTEGVKAVPGQGKGGGGGKKKKGKR